MCNVQSQRDEWPWPALKLSRNSWTKTSYLNDRTHLIVSQSHQKMTSKIILPIWQKNLSYEMLIHSNLMFIPLWEWCDVISISTWVPAEQPPLFVIEHIFPPKLTTLHICSTESKICNGITPIFQIKHNKVWWTCCFEFNIYCAKIMHVHYIYIHSHFPLQSTMRSLS